MVPAGTEIVAALNGIDRLAAVSHDCDWPPGVRDLPNITRCDIDGLDLSSEDIDRWVQRTLAERGSLYTIDEAQLRRIAPTAILTQQLCDVCGPTYGSVAQLAGTLARPPTGLASRSSSGSSPCSPPATGGPSWSRSRGAWRWWGAPTRRRDRSTGPT